MLAMDYTGKHGSYDQNCVWAFGSAFASVFSSVGERRVSNKGHLQSDVKYEQYFK